jgi:hypothetical protein
MYDLIDKPTHIIEASNIVRRGQVSGSHWQWTRKKERNKGRKKEGKKGILKCIYTDARIYI